MNTVTLVIGAAVFAFGLYTAILRRISPHKLGKLAALKELFGEHTGNRIHLMTYAVLPLVAGTIFMFAGFRGISLF